ncbi:ketopantoate hydroxymethyltransferase-domain-containing protein [Aspergillus ambiguus]|uniref:3-methyl-2-oxobutanoate hydroxymethyltransferase n=1 Tax=Aspergillus ambiguus TaxID=176160 RepID=UPI003CCE3999
MALRFAQLHSRKLRIPFTSRSSLVPSNASILTTSFVRYSSHSPLGRTETAPRKKVTIQTLNRLHNIGEPISVLTAHDFTSGLVADTAGIEVVLVGDSLAMVALGMEDTNELLMDEMLVHCRSVARAVNGAFTVADLPMGSYEASPEQAVQSAIRIMKEGRMKAVKLEANRDMAPAIKRITRAGIPVVAHIGLTPQRQHALGGFRVQGKSTTGAMNLLQDALAVQEAGAFMVLIEAVPAEIAAIVTQKLRIPTIGIGSGNGCSGQVLVQVDMTGNFPPGRFVPKFVKRYADVWGESLRGIKEYRQEVKTRTFPSPDHTYPIPEESLAEFLRVVDSAFTGEKKME